MPAAYVPDFFLPLTLVDQDQDELWRKIRERTIETFPGFHIGESRIYSIEYTKERHTRLSQVGSPEPTRPGATVVAIFFSSSPYIVYCSRGPVGEPYITGDWFMIDSSLPLKIQRFADRP